MRRTFPCSHMFFVLHTLQLLRASPCLHVAVTAALQLKGFALPVPSAAPPPSLGDTEDIDPIDPIDPIDTIDPIDPIDPIDIGAMPPMCGFGAMPPEIPSASFSRCTPDTSCRGEGEEEDAEKEAAEKGEAEKGEAEKEAVIGATRAAVEATAAGEAPARWRGAPMSASPVVWFIWMRMQCVARGGQTQ